jgi:hypothetical protein
MITGIFWTGASLNPARSLAPAIVEDNWPSYHWIYYIGPIAGSMVAVIFYKLIKALEYESIHETDESSSPSPVLPTREIEAKQNAMMNSIQIGPAGVPETLTRPVPPPPKEENASGLPSADHD